MNLPFSFGIASMCVAAGQLPRRQFWIGEGLRPGDDARVTLALYGEATLTVIRTQCPVATPDIGERRTS